MKRKNNEGSIFYNSSRNRWNAQYKIKEDGKIKDTYIQIYLNSLIAKYSDSSISKIYGRGEFSTFRTIFFDIPTFQGL